MKKKMILSIFSMTFCLIAVSILFIQQKQMYFQAQPTYSPAANSLRQLLPVSHPEQKEKITIGAIGDILIHSPVYQDAFNGAEYNFDPIFEKVKPILEKPDVLTANQESRLGGLELGLSGYPAFNSPYEVADALVHIGVDIVSTANNHTLDKGAQGIQLEAAYLDQISLPHVGSFINDKDQKKLRIIDKKGIKIAFLSYTYGTNGIPVPKGNDFLVNLIDRNRMKEEIHRAKSAADVVVMSIHWGNEYKRTPNKEQKELANYLANEGVDIIFGSHPHVLQPMEWLKTKDGRNSFVIYSLGNFISGQFDHFKDIGGLVTLDIRKDHSDTGMTIEISNPVFTPTYVASEKDQHYRVVPLEEAGTYGLSNAKARYHEIQEHMNQYID